MDLEVTIMDTLGSTSQALTFDEVVKGVAQKLEPQIREKLNELAGKDHIKCHQGGRDQPWRYQGNPITRRNLNNAARP